MVMSGSGEFGKEENLLLLLALLFQKFGQPFESCIPECREEIEKACVFMKQHYAEHIYLDQICRYAGLSKSTLLRAFTKSKGVTPYLYLQNIRIGEAKNLLEQGVAPIEAALSTGFSDQSHFTNYFNSFIGLAPAFTVTFLRPKREAIRMENKQTIGHLSALLTIIIWGTTFISTKILLVDFQPVEILFFRFIMGLLILMLVYPHRLKGTTPGQEMTFVAAGLCGICMYYLLENIALTYTLASNVGVIISVAPFFTAILTHLFLKRTKNCVPNFFVGFVVAMAGIFLISFNGSKLELNPTGDLLALLAALVWACYSVLTKENQRIWLQYHSYHKTSVLLWHPVYDTCSIPV